MANPNDDNQFGLGDVRGPLQRAEAVEKRHESHGWFAKTWNFVAGAAPFVAVADQPWLLSYRLATDKRILRVITATGRSLDAASYMMGSETLKIGQGLLAGIVPMLGDLARDVGIGAVAGGAVGAVGGLGILDEATIPGGALAGAELALWIGGFLGLKDILLEGAKHLGRFSSYAIDATELAWYAGEDREVSTEHDINDASKLFAVAISELWWVILQSLILWVMKRAAELAGSAVGAAAKSEAFQTALNDAKGKTAKFGVQFGDWFEKNFNQIKNTVDQRERELKQVEAGDAGRAPNAPQQQNPSAPKPKTGTVLSGHGSYHPSSGTTVVPEGTQVTFYSEHGSTITDPLGNAVETGKDVSNVFQRTFGPGDVVPNYTLHPPTGLNIMGSPTTVTQPTNLSDLLQPNMGNVDWAACTYNPSEAGGNLRYGLDGIFDKSTGQYITQYTKP